MTNQYISLKHAAELAGVHPASLRHAIRRGSLHAERFGRDWFTTQEWLNTYIANKRTWKTNTPTGPAGE